MMHCADGVGKLAAAMAFLMFAFALAFSAGCGKTEANFKNEHKRSKPIRRFRHAVCQSFTETPRSKVPDKRSKSKPHGG